MTERTKMPTKNPPGHEWIYGQCYGGKLDGKVKDVPKVLEVGQIVRWHEGYYMVGPIIEGTNVRVMVWWDD